MIHGLTGLRCSGNHEHQIIEGQVLFQGQRISRSSFTEHYSRKIARILAMTFGKVQAQTLRDTVSFRPYRNDTWSVLAAEEHPEAPKPKRARVNRYTSAKLSRALAVTKLPQGK